jgi:Mrp family chromosome partitioning ATPase
MMDLNRTTGDRGALDGEALHTFEPNDLIDRSEVAPADDGQNPSRETGFIAMAAAESEEITSDEAPNEQLKVQAQSQILGGRRQLRECADDLKRVLATLAKGNSGHRTTQRVVVAGANTGADASRIAWGLALTSAASGFRVLLVDTNLNRPAAHIQFGLSNDFGLSDLLLGADSPHRFPQSTRIPNLAVIAAGTHASTYASLLARGRVFHRLQPLAKYFDYIIADAGSLTPALLARVSEGADNVVVAVRKHASSMNELASLVRTLRDEAAPEACVLMIE